MRAGGCPVPGGGRGAPGAAAGAFARAEAALEAAAPGGLRGRLGGGRLLRPMGEFCRGDAVFEHLLEFEGRRLAGRLLRSQTHLHILVRLGPKQTKTAVETQPKTS